MDENPSPETPAPADPGLNKLDLTQLQGFSFGTQWTQEKHDPRDSRRGDDRPRREDRREGPGGPDRRDRRGFRKPAGDAPAAGAGGAPSQERREGFDRGPGGGGPRGEFRGGPRRDFRGGPRRDEGGAPRGDYRGGGGRGGYQAERGPYESPFYTVTFYPEDASFATLAKTIRSSCRTIELFEIARTVIGKLERFVVVLQRKTPAAAKPESQSAPQAGEGAPAAAAPHVPGVKQAPLYISVPDNLPFDAEDAAIAHVLSRHLGQFFDMAEVEVEPPKGNFQIVNRCGVTGELLGPPNYHRYNQIVQQHFAARINRMPFDLYRSKIESVRDPEVVNQWLEKMKKVTRYTWKAAKPAAVVAPAEAPAAEGEVASPAAEAPAALSFDTIEDARVHLLTHAREKVVRMAEGARFHGAQAENLPPGEIRRAVEGALERQRRFPLDTANALRGRLRREGFTIFKKGSKGISYVCAVKRKFRVPGQTFSDSINNLITYIEAHPMVRATELPQKFLGIDLPKASEAKAPQPAPAAPVADPAAQGDAAAAPASEAAAPAPAAPAEAKPELNVEQREKMARMQGDLMWLVREGYVTEFIDGRLFAPPPMVEARKKEVESEDHDPENFPEAPPADPAPAAPTAPAESTPEAVAPAAESPAAEVPPAVDVAPAPEEAAPAAADDSAPAEAPAPAAQDPEKPAQP